jgi:prepilin-type processing-associated H-X9-DG protein
MRNAVQAFVLALILGVCAGLLAPAVVKVREAAARAECRNNLRQVGLALHNYRDTENTFPPAAMPNPSLPPGRRLSWLVAIVPYVEANYLYSKMDKDKGWDAEENRFAALAEWRVFLCPGYPEGPPASTLAPTHYVGLTGLGADAIELPAGHPRAGFFGYERKLTLADVPRRSATLLVAAETARASGSWTAAGPPTARGLEQDAGPYLGRSGPFGGTHRGGANALFADGSVRFVRESVDPRAFEAAAALRGDPGAGPIGEE